MDYEQELEFVKDLALAAGKIFHKYFQVTGIGSIKSDGTMVTKADHEINDLVIKEISRRHPNHSIWGEEKKHIIDDSSYTWVCDPIDGTMPFAKSLPISSFLLALVDSKGKSVLGLAYDPFLKKIYWAIEGKGAFCNGNQITVSSHTSLDGAYIDEELWINHEEGVIFDNPKDKFNKQNSKVITLCSAGRSSMLVAEGEMEAMIFGQTKPEDIAAFSVIVTEAGGLVTDLFGRTQRYDRPILGAVVSNGKIHDKIVRITADMNYSSPYIS